MGSTFARTARPLLSTEESMATPCSVNGDGDEPDRDRSAEFPGGARRLYARVAADARAAQNDPAARLWQHRGAVQGGFGKAAGAGSQCRRRRGAADPAACARVG